MRKTAGSAARTLDKVANLVRERIADEDLRRVESFVRHYFAGLAREDVGEREPENLYGAALGHWNLFRSYKHGKPKIHVYNPVFERHGWQSTHTVIEIVSDDMPFLVDSARMALNERGLTVHLIIHPVMRAQRDARGRVLEVTASGDQETGTPAQAVMHFEVDRQTEKSVLDEIRADLDRVLRDVRIAVEDWPPMRDALRQVVSELERKPPPLSAEDLAEGRAFLQWIDEGHFVYLGYREYTLHEEGGETVLFVSSPCKVPRGNGRASAAP